MDQDQLKALLAGININVQGDFVAQKNVGSVVKIGTQYVYNTTATTSPQQPQDDHGSLHKRIERLMQATDRLGNAIVKGQQDWLGVLRCLELRGEFNSGPQYFCSLINDLDIALTAPCKLASVKKAMQDFRECSGAIEKWPECHIKLVAQTFMQICQEAGQP